MYQKIILLGNLGRDPEMKYTPSGHPVTNLSLAVNRRWTNDDGTAGEEVAWFQVSAWGRLAEICNQYLSRGQGILVEGRLKPGKDGRPRIWTGKDGQARASFEVVANVIKFLDRRDADATEAVQGELPGTMESEDFPF
jgi:single-strand DNA-binding protein